jgi:ribonuclease R
MARKAQTPDTDSLGRALFDFLQRPDYEPLPQRQLIHRMNIPSAQRPALRRLIKRGVAQGGIVSLSGGRIAAAIEHQATAGTLQRHPDGYGFVVLDEGGEDVFIPPRSLGASLSGDRVAVRLTGRGRGRRLQGEIVKTLRARSRRLIGVFRGTGRSGVVHPFDPSFAQPIHIPAAFRGGAHNRDVVSVEVLRAPGAGGPAEGKILESIGHFDDPGIDIVVVAQKYRLPLEFTESVLDAASALPSRVERSEVARRRRFDTPAPVTIDGETAQDFDDAIAVEERPRGGFRLHVHIADVAHFVPAGSVLDAEARRRGTSVYFPGTVLPMFPEKLSNDLCSLRPGVDRLVQSALLDFDRHGALQRARFADGVIRSAARLTYGQVARVLEGDHRGSGVPTSVVAMLRVAERLRALLEERRRARGSIDFDLPEPQILLDVEGEMTGVHIEPRNVAHRMIEEFMLAANEAVAAHLESGTSPCMYRVHDAPDPAKLEALTSFVESFGLKLQLDPADPSPRQIQHALDQLEQRAEYELISRMALRSMKQALYSVENTGHFGLAAATYCHFTSPIRRYPDLVVHRLLRRFRTGLRSVEDWHSELETVAESASELERNAEAAEREFLVWKKLAFIRDRIGETFNGVITGVARFGVFVQLTDSLAEGLLHVERLGAEFFELDEKRQELRGAISGRRFRLGDRVEIRLERVDRILQRVDLSLAEDSGPRRDGAGRRAKGGPRREPRRSRQAPHRRRRGR